MSAAVNCVVYYWVMLSAFNTLPASWGWNRSLVHSIHNLGEHSVFDYVACHAPILCHNTSRVDDAFIVYMYVYLHSPAVIITVFSPSHSWLTPHLAVQSQYMMCACTWMENMASQCVWVPHLLKATTVVSVTFPCCLGYKRSCRYWPNGLTEISSVITSCSWHGLAFFTIGANANVVNEIQAPVSKQCFSQQWSILFYFILFFCANF